MKKITWLKTDLSELIKRINNTYLSAYLEDGDPKEEWVFSYDLDDLAEEIKDSEIDVEDTDGFFEDGEQGAKDGEYIIKQAQKEFEKKKNAYWKAVKKAGEKLLA